DSFAHKKVSLEGESEEDSEDMTEEKSSSLDEALLEESEEEETVEEVVEEKPAPVLIHSAKPAIERMGIARKVQSMKANLFQSGQRKAEPSESFKLEPKPVRT